MKKGFIAFMVCLGLAMAFAGQQSVRWLLMGNEFVRTETTKTKKPLSTVTNPTPNYRYYTVVEQQVHYHRGTFPLIQRDVLKESKSETSEEL